MILWIGVCVWCLWLGDVCLMLCRVLVLVVSLSKCPNLVSASLCILGHLPCKALCKGSRRIIDYRLVYMHYAKGWLLYIMYISTLY